MMDMNNLIKQAQNFQKKLAQSQEELAQKTVTSSVGGGMVIATVNGRHELLAIKIEKEVLDADDPRMIEDLVVAAVNDAMQKAKTMIQEEMGKLTGGLNIPGLF